MSESVFSFLALCYFEANVILLFGLGPASSCQNVLLSEIHEPSLAKTRNQKSMTESRSALSLLLNVNLSARCKIELQRKNALETCWLKQKDGPVLQNKQ